MSIRTVTNRAAASVLCLLLSGCPTTPLNLPTQLQGFAVAAPQGSFLSSNSSLTVAAACPAGTVAVGGGWSAGTDSATRVRSSTPLPGGAGWTVTATNARLLGASIFLRPFAICVTAPQGYALVSTAGSLQSQETNSVEAVCPSTTHVATGGGSATTSAEVHGFSQQIVLQPAPERYRVAGRSSLLLPGQSDFSAAALCADFTQVPGRELVLSPTVQVGPGSRATLSADCPVGKSALHGAVMSLASGLVTLESFPVNGATGWSAQAHNPAIFGGTLSARLQLVCASAAR